MGVRGKNYWSHASWTNFIWHRVISIIHHSWLDINSKTLKRYALVVKQITVYRPVVPVYARFLDRSISAFQSISRNSEGHVGSVQPIKCMIFILTFNKTVYMI